VSYPFNPKPFSYSALKKFLNCPRQYGEIVVYKNYQDVFTSPKGDYGDKLHKAAEAYVRDGGSLDEEFGFLRPMFDTLRALPGDKRCEHKMAMTPDGKPTRWNDPERWFQGIADLTVINPSSYIARCLDYKTGDVKYADTDQLELMALLIFAHHPHVKLVKGRLLFVLSGQPRDRNIGIDERDRLMQKWREKDALRRAAIDADKFPPKQSGLCKKHCAVLSCEMNGRR
jgi:hypothetical protein